MYAMHMRVVGEVWAGSIWTWKNILADSFSFGQSKASFFKL